MACSSNNPCYQPTCNACNTVNPCYDNCGCLNPTDWDCLNNPGTHDALDVINSDTGDIVLEKINDAINDLKEDRGLVLVEEGDLCDPHGLFEQLQAGSGIAIQITGSDCDKKVLITNVGDAGPAIVDSKVLASNTDTGSSNYLFNKLAGGTYVQMSKQSAGTASEKIKFDITLSTIISSDSGNQLTQGSDGKLKTSYIAPDGSETKVVAGSGITKSGTGTSSDPYIISTLGTIVPTRAYFDGLWKTITFTNGGNPNVSVTSQSVKYRLRFDGTIEFKGNLTYSAVFSSGTGNKITLINVSNIVTGGANNLASAEIDRIVDMKNLVTFDVPTTIATNPNLVGYTIRMMAGGIISIELIHNTVATKSIVLSFDGCQYHPNI